MSNVDRGLSPEAHTANFVRNGGASRRAAARAADWMVDHLVLSLCIAWLAQLAYFKILQAAGMPFGLEVWPMGESRNWIRVLLDHDGVGFAREFWQLDGRNPLSPWWYAFFRVPILQFDPTMYLLRKLAELLLATGATVLLSRLWHGRMNGLAILAGLMILCWNFNDYYRDQVIWVFHVSLAIGLWTVCAYVAYLDGKRQSRYLFGVVLVGELACIATYTLQAGTLLVIGFVALLRGRPPGAPLLDMRRLRPAFEEIALLAAVAAVFSMIWYTALPTGGGNLVVPVHPTPAALFDSLQQLLWHCDFTASIVAPTRSPVSLLAAVGPWIVVVAIASVALRKSDDIVSGSASAWPFAMVACMALPIVALESSSSEWYPGSRSRMIYEVSTPFLLIGFAGVCATAAGSHKLRQRISLIVVAIVFAVGIPAALNYNRELVANTAIQRSFAAQLTQLAENRPDVTHFIVRWNGDPSLVWGTDAMSDTYARTFVRNRLVTLRFIQLREAPPGAWWEVRWKPLLDRDGVRYAGLRDSQPSAYATVLFLDYDHGVLSVPPVIDPAWIGSLQVAWNRDKPVMQSMTASGACPFDFRFAYPPPGGRGWSVPERMPDGTSAIWMASTQASLLAATACAGDVTVTLTLAGAMAPDIVDGLRFEIDGREVALRRTDSTSAATVLQGATTLTPAQGFRKLRLTAPRTIVPKGGDRTLAVMLSGLMIAPRRP